jgi:hypothetical protein
VVHRRFLSTRENQGLPHGTHHGRVLVQENSVSSIGNGPSGAPLSPPAATVMARGTAVPVSFAFMNVAQPLRLAPPG